MKRHEPKQSSENVRATNVGRGWYVAHRPRTVAELDQEQVRAALLSFIKRGRFPHALLFAGPKGTGKTSAARLIAKILNCERAPDDGLGEPCNECTSCTEITNGISLAVVELDGASHRGIEDVRSLRDAVKLAPAGGRTKVYIIDEAHMLTTEAFNALLKTLEEPPPNVVFILATTEVHKIPETIKSRVVTIHFSQATKVEVLRALTRVAQHEEVEVEREVFEMIAQYCEGSFRDAIKFLEQMAGEGKVTRSTAEAFFSQNITSARTFLELLIKRDEKGVLSQIEELAHRGVNMRQFTIQLIEILRSELLAKHGVGSEENIEISQQDLTQLLTLLLPAFEGMRTSPIPELPLELAVIEWCGGLDDQQSIRLSRNSPPDKIGTNPRGFRPASGGDSNPLGSGLNKRDVRELPVSSLKKENDEDLRSSPVSTSGGEKDKERKKVVITDDLWEQLLAQVKPRNHSIAALLRSTKPITFDGQTLTVSVFYQFHKEKLEEELNRRIIEEVAAKVLETSPLRMVFELGERPVPVPSGTSVGKPKEDDVSSPRRQSSGESETEASAQDEDIIRVAEEIFGGKLQS